MSAGGTIATSTATLTAGYLSGIDAFYTSLLNSSLSAAEQTALQDWVAASGILIVSADASRNAQYDSFVSVYGVTNWGVDSDTTTATVVAAHQITTNVTTVRYALTAPFTHGADAQLLMTMSTGEPSWQF